MYLTAVLQLEDMFDGGGVTIDNYTIEIDGDMQLEISGPTYSIEVAYNTTLPYNITLSAHSCAGHSDPHLITISTKTRIDKEVYLLPCICVVTCHRFGGE